MVVLYDLQVSTPLFFIMSMSCVSFEEESMFVCLFEDECILFRCAAYISTQATPSCGC